MQEVVFQNGKLVLQKRKISQMDESFLIASKALDKKKETELERLKDGGFNNLVMCLGTNRCTISLACIITGR